MGAKDMPIELRKPPHPVCVMLRELRHAARLSLAQVEEKYGINAVVLGSYERGDRLPSVGKVDAILRRVYGYELRAVPVGSKATRLSGDMVTTLRAIADQLEERDALSPLS